VTVAGTGDPVGPFPSPDETVVSGAATEALAIESRKRRRLRSIALVLAVLLVGVSALAAFFWVRGDRWAAYAAGVESDAGEIGEDLAQLRAEHEGTVAELTTVQEQLAASQQRVTELAAEKAEVGDDREAQRQLVDYQERISAAAGSVATSLNECINRQQELLGYLDNAAAYDPADVTRFRQQVDALCASASTANDSLQQELARGATGTGG